ncbi:hypothetical protein OIV83_000120 [Microbotryomycetes sp. JL201]|nr:hypothetical protein OIV83_000120 [Microbotryomycetes sp. JL201]
MRLSFFVLVASAASLVAAAEPAMPTTDCADLTSPAAAQKGVASHQHSSESARWRAWLSARLQRYSKHRKSHKKRPQHGQHPHHSATTSSVRQTTTAKSATTVPASPHGSARPTSVPPLNLAVSHSRFTKSRKPVSTTRRTTSIPHSTTYAPAATQPVPAPAADDSLKSLALKAHNEFRAKHDAVALKWSNSLAAAAQKWSDRCVFEHGGGKGIGAGENLAATSDSKASITVGVKMWTDEVKDYNPANPHYDHFTQVVWRKTTELGCAKSTCPSLKGTNWGGSFFVCLYSPPGNMLPYSNAAENVHV